MSASEQDTNKTNKEKGKNAKKVRLGAIFMCALIALVLIALVVAISLYFTGSMKNDQTENDSSISDYIALFSILITMISVLIPIVSYLNNKDEFNRYKEGSEELNKETKRQIKENKKTAKEIEYTSLQMIEGILSNNDLYDDKKEPYYNATIEYAAAKDDFNNGSYKKCENALSTAIGFLIKCLNNHKEEEKRYSLFLRKTREDEEEYNDFKDESKKTEKKHQILIYKVFNLYRKLAGRTRNFENFDKQLCKFKNQESLSQDDKIKNIINYIYIRAELDKIEKCFITDEANAFFAEELKKQIQKFDNDEMKLQFYSLMSRYYYVLSYHEVLRNYNEAYEMAKKAKQIIKNDMCCGQLNSIIKEETTYMLAYIFEKISYCFETTKKGECLRYADELLEKLIEEKKKSKYYLEHSEVLSKMDDGAEKKKLYEYTALYGYQVDSSDPFLAAQCAQIYLRKYLKNRENGLNYLLAAKEYMIVSYYVYNREIMEAKKEGKDPGESGRPLINAKFSFIPSLHAYIQTQVLLSNTGIDEVDKEDIKKCIMHSIEIDKIKVPNYFRGIVCFYNLYNKANNTTEKAEYSKLIKSLIEKYSSIVAKTFKKGAYFYEISEKIAKLNDKIKLETENDESKVISALEGELIKEIEKYA